MKLSDLRPEHGRILSTDRHFLMFDCAVCGPPYRVYIQFHRLPQETGVWHCSTPYVVVPSLEHLGELPDIQSLTLSPSVRFNSHGLKHPYCGWHFNIVNGEVHSA